VPDLGIDGQDRTGLPIRRLRAVVCRARGARSSKPSSATFVARLARFTADGLRWRFSAASRARAWSNSELGNGPAASSGLKARLPICRSFAAARLAWIPAIQKSECYEV
jgi:hypothetical protein